MKRWPIPLGISQLNIGKPRVKKDIDTDFAPSIRDKVIGYVAKRYAYKEDYLEELKGTVCAINTEGVLAAKSAIRQVGKVTGVSLTVCDKIAKLIPSTIGTTLKSALAEEDSLKRLYENDSEARRLLNDAMLVEGTPVQTGVHAAGVIIADKPISEYAPMFWNEKKQTWVIQYDMVACESDCGMLKMDFLGLRNLDIILRCKQFVRKAKGLEINSFAVEKADDERVIAGIYGKGDTDGVFQFESPGMKKTLRSFGPKRIEDVILLNAAYRPGPMQYIPKVTDVKFGKAQAKYVVPEMKDILDSTYGSPIYQEQIQKVFHEVAGFSLGEADIIRRAMSKKHLDELEAAKDGFVKGFKARGGTDEDIEQFWNELLEFAKYAFNKSHAAAYSVLSYYTAWLKYYFPVEYLASLMSYSTKETVGLYVKNAKERNIKVLPPHVNYSLAYTAPTKDGAIRFGLEGLKDVGTAAEKVFLERKAHGAYKSLDDFILRCVLTGVDKGPSESLIRAGALGELVANRRQVIENLPIYIAAAKAALRNVTEDWAGDKEMAYNCVSAGEAFKLPAGEDFAEYDQDTILRQEKDYTGYYVSGNPLERHKDLLSRYAHTPIEALTGAEEDVCLVGQITGLEVLKRKSDGKPMCKFCFEDLTGSIDAVCFPWQYEKIQSQLKEGGLALLKVSVEAHSQGDGENFQSEDESLKIQGVVRSARKLM